MELLRSSPVARCALVMALCALAVALTTLALALVKRPPAQQQQPPTEVPSFPAALETLSQQNYAQLVLKLHRNSSIVPRRLDWHTHSVKGAFLGKAFAYNITSQMLVVKISGLYCIYAQINLTHHLDKRETLNANLTIYHQTDSSSSSSCILLNLPLHRVYDSSQTLPDFKAVLHRLAENDKLYVTIRVNSKQKGSLQPRGSFFGLFQLHET
nr:PREDICTED: uncharacterized protein LOC103277725 [Anolis carolinensis]|eukprot:XP_008101909.1 PREDICTED: uncharacterized protein LOC103277725 [Anolis carolinensis]